MNKVPDYLTRYYVASEDPFISLNDLPLEQANEIKRMHCHRNKIDGFYAEDVYLVHRKEIEKWIYDCLIKKGGKPDNTVPVYMTLGSSLEGEFDIRADIQANSVELRIPVSEIDLSAVTFTFPDSMYKFITDIEGNVVGGGRTNNPDVYLYHELETVIKKYKTDLHYIEAQIWNRKMLYKFIKRHTHD